MAVLTRRRDVLPDHVAALTALLLAERAQSDRHHHLVGSLS